MDCPVGGISDCAELGFLSWSLVGFVIEGIMGNVFLERGGKLLTPKLARGVLRAELLESG
jgi:branched-subunit amino acid aminotransferase/4-amino-4-deoxychorismate lyase